MPCKSIFYCSGSLRNRKQQKILMKILESFQLLKQSSETGYEVNAYFEIIFEVGGLEC